MMTVIIQARMGSKRYPGKVLAPLNEMPLISHVLRSAIRSGASQIIFAISNKPEDEPLRRYLENQECVAGDPNDVLKRFYDCGQIIQDKSLPIIRATGDCPLVDHRTMQQLVEAFTQRNVPYLGITNCPDGDDVEVFSWEALKEANAKASSMQDREHVTPYLRRMKGALEWKRPEGEEDIEYSVNDLSDLQTCQALIDDCGEGATCAEYCKAYRSRFMTNGKRK